MLFCGVKPSSSLHNVCAAWTQEIQESKAREGSVVVVRHCLNWCCDFINLVLLLYNFGFDPPHMRWAPLPRAEVKHCWSVWYNHKGLQDVFCRLGKAVWNTSLIFKFVWSLTCLSILGPLLSSYSYNEAAKSPVPLLCFENKGSCRILIRWPCKARNRRVCRTRTWLWIQWFPAALTR